MARPVYVLTVGGVPVKMRLGFTIQESVNAQTRFTADVYSPDGSFIPALGADVQLTEDGVVIFGGTITTPTAAGPGNEPIRPIITKLDVNDYNSLPTRRICNGTFPAGTLKSWLQLVVPYLSIYGVSLDPAQVDGPVLGELLASYMRLDDVLNQFSTLSGWVWEITYTKLLRMIDPNTTAAPFDVLDGNRMAIGDISVAPTQKDYGNKVLVLFGTGLHETADDYVGDGTTATFPLTYPFAAARGYVTNNPPGHNPADPDVNETLGTPPALWSVDPNNSTLTRVAGPPVAGAHIHFIYTAQFPSLVTAGNPPWPTPPGYWEKLYREPDVFDEGQAQQLANGYLPISLNLQNTVKYVTKQRNVHPGMVQWIQNSQRHINSQCLITDVQIKNDTGAEADRSVTALEGTDLGTSWRDMIRSWNQHVSGASGSPAYIPPSGGGTSGGASIVGTNDYIVKIGGLNQGIDSSMSESGGVVDYHGGSVVNVHIPDAALSTNIPRLDAITNAFGGSITIGGTLGVTGNTTLGNAAVGGTLGVTGTTTLGVVNAGASTLASANVTGNTTIGGTLGVTGTSTLGAVNAGSTAITGTLTVSGAATFPSAVTLSGNLYLANANSINWRNAAGNGWLPVFVVDGNNALLLGQTLSYSLYQTHVWPYPDNTWDCGNASFRWRNASIAGALTVGGAASLGATTINGTLGVQGIASAAAFHVTASTPGAAGQVFVGNDGLTLWAQTGPAADFAILNPSGNPIVLVPSGLTYLQIYGGMGSPDYVSGTTGWRVSPGGQADFRGITSDQMHLKTFVVDQNRALTGGEIIANSAAVIAADFTVPAYGAAATLEVADLVGAPGMAAFAVGDTVQMRQYSRANGALTYTWAAGVVTNYAALPGNLQSWTWTRGATASSGGGTAAGAVVATAGVALDYGASGDGWFEIDGADGPYNANGPYCQIVTWQTDLSTLTVRTRLGNLYGITNVVGEYGFIAGTYATGAAGQYIRASSTAFEIHGVDVLLFDGASNTVKIDHTAPYIAVGNPRPVDYNNGVGVFLGKSTGGAYTFYVGKSTAAGPPYAFLGYDGTALGIGGATVTLYDATGTATMRLNPGVPSFSVGNPMPTGFGAGGAGVWMGRDTDGVYKWFCGAGGGNYLSWNGSTATIAGSIFLLGNATASYGSGLYLGANAMGYYNVTYGWLSYLDNAGRFYLNSPSGAHGLSWDGTTLTITGTASILGGAVGGFTITATDLTATNLVIHNGGYIVVGPPGGPNSVTISVIDTGWRLWTGSSVNGLASTASCGIQANGTFVATQLQMGFTQNWGQFTQSQGAFIYPGSNYGLSNYQQSYYFASNATWGMYCSTNLYLNGGLYMAGSVYVYPGSATGEVGQQSWYLASHSSYGLYTNTGLYVASNVWAQNVIANNGSVQGNYHTAAAGNIGYCFYGDSGTGMRSDVVGRMVLVASSAAGSIYWDGLQMFPGDTNVRYIGTNASAFHQMFAYAFTVASDATLKHAIRPTSYGAAFIRGLRPVDFEYLNEPGHVYQGLVAQEVAALAPAFGALSRDARGEAVGLDYGKFVVPLIATMQDVLNRLDTLEKRIHGE